MTKKSDKYNWIKDFCLSLQGASFDHKVEWQADRYLIEDKMFGMQCLHKSNRPIITLKLLPENGSFYRGQYKDVIAGYYMNKVHWNSVFLDSDFPEDVLKDMIRESYDLVLNSFSKKKQAAILGDVK